MESNFDVLTDQCKIFKKSVEDIKIGAKSHQNCTTVEEKVIQLKQLNKFLNTKLQVINVDSKKENKALNLSSDDINATKNDLLDKVNREQIDEKLCRTIYTGKMIKDLKNNTSDTPEIKLYKQKICEQLVNLNTINDQINEVVVKQQNVLQETLALKMELIAARKEYTEKLAERREKKAKEKDNKMDNDYKDKLDKMEKRVSKINFMRVIISRLLINGNIKWREYKEFLPIFERMRFPVTLDDFKKNSLETK